MSIITEPRHAGEFIRGGVANFNSYMSDKITLAAGQNLDVGTVLGRITASGKYAQLDPGASDGTEKAMAILFYATDATSEDKPCIVAARSCEVFAESLLWPDGITDEQKATALDQLDARGIVAR